MLRRLFPPVVGLLLMIAVPALLSAKGKTVRVAINGPDLKSPIEITDPAIVTNFNVWTGPGTSTNEAKSLIVDWSKGAISSAPKGLPVYEVSFYEDVGNREEKLIYVISYEYDPSSRHGYVYLPGNGDRWHRLNVSSIFHGVEGNWFSAWNLWDDVAIPLIEKAKVKASTSRSKTSMWLACANLFRLRRQSSTWVSRSELALFLWWALLVNGF